MLEKKTTHPVRVLIVAVLTSLFLGSMSASAVVALERPPQAPPGIAAVAAAVVDIRTGKVLYELNGDARRPVASLTKIATALTALDVLNTNETMTMTAEAKAVAGQNSDLPVGMTLSVRDAMAYLLLPSDNDVAVALAQRVSGREETFVGGMNLRVRGLGLKNTAFVDSYGLAGGLDHFSTAKDMAQLSAIALNNKTIATLAARREVTVTIAGKPSVITNRNELVGSYQGAVGLKTGHTEPAGYCLAAAARRGQAGVVAVVLGAPTREASFQDAKALLDYAFASSQNEVLIERDKIYARRHHGRATLPLLGAKTIRRVIWLPAGELRRRITLNKIPRETLVKKGQELGEIRVLQGGRLLASASLVSAVDEPPPPGLLERLASFLRNLW